MDWQFIQSIGGISLGSPLRDDEGHVWLPIFCDVSGLTTTTVPPTAMNSGIVCIPPRVRICSNTVFLTVRTSVPGNKAHDRLCPSADLGTLDGGRYAVVYQAPAGDQHPLGSILIMRR